MFHAREYHASSYLPALKRTRHGVFKGLKKKASSQQARAQEFSWEASERAWLGKVSKGNRKPLEVGVYFTFFFFTFHFEITLEI